MMDHDVKVVNRARKALLESTSHEMLRANILFLYDYFIAHPSPHLPEQLRPR